jgi:type II secretion system protein H
MDATMHPSQHGKRASAGFTLIELTVVVVLLGILVALAAPNMAAYVRGTKVDRALDELTGDIAYARMLAIRSGQSTQLRIQPTGTAYVITAVASGQVAKQVDLSRDFRGVSLAPTSTDIRFNSRGLLLPEFTPSFTGDEMKITAQQGSSSASLTILRSGRAYRVY